MTNPFKKIVKNVKESPKSSYDFDHTAKGHVSSLTCEQCGAPRPKNTNLARCVYCGYQFMVTNEDIRAKK